MPNTKQYNANYYVDTKYHILEKYRLKYKYGQLYKKKQRYNHDNDILDTLKWYNKRLNKYGCGLGNPKWLFMSPDEIEDVLCEMMERLMDINYANYIRNNAYNNVINNLDI